MLNDDDDNTQSYSYQITTSSHCPSINRIPMLIDWINTINEPNCLLLSSIEELHDGRVMIEIGKHLLKQQGYYNALNQISNTDKSTPKDRFNKLLSIINLIDDTKNISLFKSNVNSIGKNAELLTDLIEVLRELSISSDENRENEGKYKEKEGEEDEDGYYHGTLTVTSKENNNNNYDCITIEENNVDDSNGNSNGIINKQVKEKDNYDANVINTQSNKDEIHNYELTEKEYVTIESNIKEQETPLYDDLQIEKKNNFCYHCHNNNNNKGKTNKEAINKSKPLSFIPQKYPIDHKQKLISKPKPKRIEPIKTSSFFILPSTNNTLINRPKNRSKQICQRNLTSIFGLSTVSKLKYDSSYLPYYKFHKPTELIIESNFNQLMKKNTFNRKPNKEDFNERDFFIMLSNAKPTLKHNDFIIPYHSKQSKSMQLNNIVLNTPQPQRPSSPSLLDNTKTRIYLWLKDIRMIKRNSIDIYDLPSLCINGIFLCDLINKCEGRFETIHGINRVIRKETQIKANIRRALEYLRSKESFPSRHLWSSDGIRNGNGEIIWELLEDIWLFYTNKVHKSSKSLRNIFINESNDLKPHCIRDDSTMRNEVKSVRLYLNKQSQRGEDRKEFMNHYCQSPVVAHLKRMETPTIQIFNHFSYNNHNNNTLSSKTNKTNSNTNESQYNNNRKNIITTTSTNNNLNIGCNSKPKRNYILFEKLALKGLKNELNVKNHRSTIAYK